MTRFSPGEYPHSPNPNSKIEYLAPDDLRVSAGLLEVWATSGPVLEQAQTLKTAAIAEATSTDDSLIKGAAMFDYSRIVLIELIANQVEQNLAQHLPPIDPKAS